MTKHRCPTCHWQEDGHCHYNPPTVTLLMAQGIGGNTPQPISYHPPVRQDEYCSRHSAVSSNLIDVGIVN